MPNLFVRNLRAEQPQAPANRDQVRWLPWDPFRQMVPFLTSEDQPQHFLPDFDVRETPEDFVFRADVPGFNEQDLEITMIGNRLTIIGKREPDPENAADIHYVRERVYGGFSRAFTMPEGTDCSDTIRAELARGVLTLSLPKRPEVQPRKIPVQVSETPTS
ncbi:MAG: Hsp20 family protein [Polyangiaceae bacterium]|nr:Hsp20 family protein [Polyangiaceae bacterium]